MIRAVVELVALVLQLILAILHTRDALSSRLKDGKELTVCKAADKEENDDKADQPEGGTEEKKPRCRRCCRLHSLRQCCCRCKKKRTVRLPSLRAVIIMVPHLAMLAAVVQRLVPQGVDASVGSCDSHISLLVLANFSGWLRIAEYLLRRTLVYKPKDLNRDWSPRFSALRDKYSWIRAKTAYRRRCCR